MNPQPTCDVDAANDVAFWRNAAVRPERTEVC